MIGRSGPSPFIGPILASAALRSARVARRIRVVEAAHRHGRLGVVLDLAVDRPDGGPGPAQRRVGVERHHARRWAWRHPRLRLPRAAELEAEAGPARLDAVPVVVADDPLAATQEHLQASTHFDELAVEVMVKGAAVASKLEFRHLGSLPRYSSPPVCERDFSWCKRAGISASLCDALIICNYCILVTFVAMIEKGTWAIFYSAQW